MMRLAKRVLALMLCVALCMSIVPTAYAHTQVMTAGDFCVYLMYVVNRRDSKYGSGGVYSVGQYDGTNIYFDCWGLGESIICTRGQIVINKDPSLNPWSLWDTSCGCGSRTGDWLKSQCQLSNDFSNIITGEWLFKDDSSGHCYHVGYYIGDGQVIESTSDGGNNTQISFIDSNGRCSGISGRGSSWAWTSHAKVPWIDYSAYTGSHTHDWVFQYYWAAHPHYNSYKCSICGEEWVDRDSSNYLTNCDDCRPGKPAFIGLHNTYDVGSPVVFSWNQTEHTTHYNFWLYKEKDAGGYDTIDHSFEVTSGFQMNLGVGKYKALLQSYDSNHWLSDHSDWAYTESDPTYFEIRSTVVYTVTYDANGGKDAPSSQTKIYDQTLTLSSDVPTRANTIIGSYTVTLNANGGSVSPASLTTNLTSSYSFKNWNTAANGSGTSYAPGASYTANAALTLYAQWDSRTTTAAVNLPTPTRDDCIFLGWGTSAAAASGITGSYTPTGNVTLYAIWLVPDFVLPASLTEIGEEAFSGGAFTYVKLSESTQTIGQLAFADCPNLRYIYIPAATTSIDRYAFADVTDLTIYGKAGSTAEAFADARGFTFEAVD